MILKMCQVRILGPRESFAEALNALQDLGFVHLTPPAPSSALETRTHSPREIRLRRQLVRVLEDIDVVLKWVDRPLAAVPVPAASPTLKTFAGWARSARRLRRASERLEEQRRTLEEERGLILKYRGFFAAFEALLGPGGILKAGRAYHVILRPGQGGGVPRLRQLLETALGREFELRTHPLPGGETAVLLVVPISAAARIERILAEAGVQELSLPAAYGGRSLAEGIPRMRERLAAIPEELKQVEKARNRLAAATDELGVATAASHDRLAQLEASILCASTAHAFVLEGWVPASARTRLSHLLSERIGATIAVEEVAAEQWTGEAPVVLSNPRLLRPFELLIRLLPLPRYGTIDPTPFVAVFFPMFFGLMLGDVGYGGALAVLGLYLHRRSRPGTQLRAVAEIAGACALFTIIFGFLYGELFGELGARWFGLRPLLFDRAKGEAILPFLGLAVALGLVHVLLGLGLGVMAAVRGHPRQAVGRGLTAVMILLIVAALLAAFEVLPSSFFTPSVVLLLVAFPVLIAVEGLVAPVELLSTIGNVLSYARIMALGTASVMLAVVANRMMGAFGSVLVGTLFALLFHLVNFALGLFSPAIQALRLHYVEFFGRFYSPGGTQYRPFTHWTPSLDHPT